MVVGLGETGSKRSNLGRCLRMYNRAPQPFDCVSPHTSASLRSGTMEPACQQSKSQQKKRLMVK